MGRPDTAAVSGRGARFRSEALLAYGIMRRFGGRDSGIQFAPTFRARPFEVLSPSCYRRHRLESAKDEVRKILDELPDDVSIEEIQDRIRVRQKIRQALEDVAAERLLSEKELEKRMSRWTDK